MEVKTKFTAAVTAAVLALSAGTAMMADPLRLATEGAYPPFNYVETDGSIVGFDVDIGLALCKQAEMECVVVAQEWDGIIPGLLANKYDFIVASMFITEERRKKIAFTNPYYIAAMSHVVNKDSGLTEFTNETMSGKTIGAQAGTTQADFLEAVYPDADIRLYPTQDEANLDLASGRLDALVSDTLPATEWTTKTEDGSCCHMAGELITDPAWVGEGVGIALRQEDTELADKLNAALVEIRENGVYKEINDKYFDIDVFTMQK